MRIGPKAYAFWQDGHPIPLRHNMQKRRQRELADTSYNSCALTPELTAVRYKHVFVKGHVAHKHKADGGTVYEQVSERRLSVTVPRVAKSRR